MIKKLLNPLGVGLFAFLLVFASVVHLTYGSCQTSKSHYLFQRYWVTKNMPVAHWRKSRDSNGDFKIYFEYTGEWKEWYQDGSIKFVGNYIKAVENGSFESWYENGKRSSRYQYIDGKLEGKCEFWYANGQAKSIVVYSDFIERFSERWSKDGRFHYEVYFDKEGQFLKSVNLNKSSDVSK